MFASRSVLCAHPLLSWLCTDKLEELMHSRGWEWPNSLSLSLSQQSPFPHPRSAQLSPKPFFPFLHHVLAIQKYERRKKQKTKHRAKLCTFSLEFLTVSVMSCAKQKERGKAKGSAFQYIYQTVSSSLNAFFMLINHTFLQDKYKLKYKVLKWLSQDIQNSVAWNSVCVLQ